MLQVWSRNDIPCVRLVRTPILNRTIAWWRHWTATTRMLWGTLLFSTFFVCHVTSRSLVRDTIFINKDYSELHSCSCSQMTSTCNCVFCVWIFQESPTREHRKWCSSSAQWILYRSRRNVFSSTLTTSATFRGQLQKESLWNICWRMTMSMSMSLSWQHRSWWTPLMTKSMRSRCLTSVCWFLTNVITPRKNIRTTK